MDNLTDIQKLKKITMYVINSIDFENDTVLFLNRITQYAKSTITKCKVIHCIRYAISRYSV